MPALPRQDARESCRSAWSDWLLKKKSERNSESRQGWHRNDKASAWSQIDQIADKDCAKLSEDVDFARNGLRKDRLSSFSFAVVATWTSRIRSVSCSQCERSSEPGRGSVVVKTSTGVKVAVRGSQLSP